MAYVPCCRDLTAAAPQPSAPRSGLLRRLWNALHESRERAAEREIERFVESSGGRLTDDIERRIAQRLIGGDSRFPR